jgi:hypothetical protein
VLCLLKDFLSGAGRGAAGGVPLGPGMEGRGSLIITAHWHGGHRA